jgi:GDP-4-dehydro-6-deoxy-D-mannose reductase
MKVVVTGVNGFVGRHLAIELADQGHEVIGMGLGPPDPVVSPNLSDYHEVDLRQRWPAVDCDGVVHLAALSEVGPSFDHPQEYIEANSAPMTHLGEALLKVKKHIRIVVVSTGAVYRGPYGIAWDEVTPVVPSSPYIVSKLVTEAQSSYYHDRGLDVIVMRPFNHIGPGQRNGFLLPDLVSGIREWKKSGHPLRVGNLDTRRDYTDVRDVARAYRLALEAPRLAERVFNICSGKSISGRELLETVSTAFSFQHPPDTTDDPTKFRPGDPKDIFGDNTAIHQALGWRPAIPVLQSVRDVVQAESEIGLA